MRVIKQKKASEMSWSMIGWTILGLVVLIVLIIIVFKGAGPGFSVLKALNE